jgi:hypothetical protein
MLFNKILILVIFFLNFFLNVDISLAYIDPNTGGIIFQNLFPLFSAVIFIYIFFKKQIKKSIKKIIKLFNNK